MSEKMPRVRHILIAHAHADHTASLPVFVSEVFPALAAPVMVHATPRVIAVLRHSGLPSAHHACRENILRQLAELKIRAFR